MEFVLHLAMMLCIQGIIAIAANLLMGFAGLMSVAQAAFAGIGAYAAAFVALRHGLPFPLPGLAGALAAALASLVLSLPTMRLRGDYMAIATLGFQFGAYGLLYNWNEVTGGAVGLRAIPPPQLAGFVADTLAAQFLLGLASLALVAIAVWWLGNGPFGRLLRAIRDDELAARSLGKDVVRVKTVVFAISAALSGFGGALYAQYVSYLHPDNFDVHHSIFIISAIVVGGLANVWGAIAGAALLVLLPEALRFAALSDMMVGPVQQMIYGALLVAFVLLRPAGLVPEFGLRARKVGTTAARRPAASDAA
jgi:ABC-type branched-subunit amino acid transport system permease subunit